ncbi:hypothetical protein K438DRAFT_1749629 [Mycena galopus ATCC 62051]|nr:hypothetical protein K438DRAFT_1749629 [Mycena galopus ATCC 62051]
MEMERIHNVRKMVAPSRAKGYCIGRKAGGQGGGGEDRSAPGPPLPTDESTLEPPANGHPTLMPGSRKIEELRGENTDAGVDSASNLPGFRKHKHVHIGVGRHGKCSEISVSVNQYDSKNPTKLRGLSEIGSDMRYGRIVCARAGRRTGIDVDFSICADTEVNEPFAELTSFAAVAAAELLTQNPDRRHRRRGGAGAPIHESDPRLWESRLKAREGMSFEAWDELGETAGLLVAAGGGGENVGAAAGDKIGGGAFAFDELALTSLWDPQSEEEDVEDDVKNILGSQVEDPRATPACLLVEFSDLVLWSQWGERLGDVGKQGVVSRNGFGRLFPSLSRVWATGARRLLSGASHVVHILLLPSGFSLPHKIAASSNSFREISRSVSFVTTSIPHLSGEERPAEVHILIFACPRATCCAHGHEHQPKGANFIGCMSGFVFFSPQILMCCSCRLEPEKQIPQLLALDSHTRYLKEGPGSVYFTAHLHNGRLIIKWGVSTSVPRRQLDYHACEVGGRMQLWIVAFENLEYRLIAERVIHLRLQEKGYKHVKFLQPCSCGRRHREYYFMRPGGSLEECEEIAQKCLVELSENKAVRLFFLRGLTHYSHSKKKSGQNATRKQTVISADAHTITPNIQGDVKGFP